MDNLLRLAHQPPLMVRPDDTVLRALEMMSTHRVGAVGVARDGELVGVFTERDLMERVVLQLRDPDGTLIHEVMTTPVETVRADGDPHDALERMLNRHFRHLPVVDHRGRMLGMLSIRNLLQNELEKVTAEADSLEAYLSADGPGG